MERVCRQRTLDCFQEKSHFIQAHFLEEVLAVVCPFSFTNIKQDIKRVTPSGEGNENSQKISRSRSAYHLHGGFGEKFPSNGTGIFFGTENKNGIELYHLQNTGKFFALSRLGDL